MADMNKLGEYVQQKLMENVKDFSEHVNQEELAKYNEALKAKSNELLGQKHKVLADLAEQKHEDADCRLALRLLTTLSNYGGDVTTSFQKEVIKLCKSHLCY